jgi:hypothetical protein
MYPDGEQTHREAKMKQKIIGTVTEYLGEEHRYLRGHKVRIVAVLKNAARPDLDPDEDRRYLTDEEDLARAGGITADDRVEVVPFLEKEERFSFVSSDPRAVDLALGDLIKKQ